jgi:hypothetical protein
MIWIMKLPNYCIGLAATAFLVPCVAAQGGGQGASLTGQAVGADQEYLYWDGVREDGSLFGGRLLVDRPERPPLHARRPAQATPIFGRGTGSSNRYDLVFVGDGYTAGELGTYANDVNAAAAYQLSIEPFATYASYYSIHQVDVVSNESGVDNDPTQGIQRDTALDMAYWCGGTERLLCVDVGKAYSYAYNAPDVDQVIALANSSKYGGAGYSGSDLATSAGHNSSSLEVVAHELGHSMGNLADEYTYGGPATYTGGEPSAPNASILTASQMAAAGTKWAAWLGENQAAYDGLVDTYEGAVYSQYGVYRPTNNSKMRALGRPFNLPSIESLIIQLYHEVDPLDDHADPALVYTAGDVLWVTPMAPGGSDLPVLWLLDGALIPGAMGNTLDLSTLGLGDCDYTVSALVTDPTPWVRDQAAIDNFLTQQVDFQVSGAPVLIDCDGNGEHDPCQIAADPGLDANGNGVIDSCECQVASVCTTSPNSVGPGAQMINMGSTSVAANDLLLLALACPAGQFGIFYYGQDPVSVPLGDGVRCIGLAPPGIFRLPPISTGQGSASHQLDITSPPGAAGQITADSTWYFQFWYRDPSGPGGGGGVGHNLSDSLQINFCQ